MANQKWITLIGQRACGKSSIGQRVATMLQIPFYDLDHFIVQREGLSINQIFHFYQENGFRQRENQALLHLPAHHLVLSCGGGTVLQKDNLRFLQTRSLFIFLNTTPNTLLKRRQKDTRPLLNGFQNVHEEVSALFSQRQIIYLTIADIIIDNEQKDMETIVQEIFKELEKHG